MIANYHAHTPRCRHAWGAEEEYVRNAIARGLKIFGFSDHTPQYFPGDYYSTMRMYPQELEDYCRSILALQEAYKTQLQIPLGLEAEYYPALWKELLPRLQDLGIEYLLLGQHWVGNEIQEPYCGRPTGDEKLLARYCDQVIDALETGLFTYLAHPDLICFTGSHRAYAYHMRRLCKAARDTDTPLEINYLGVLSGRNYPDEAFWAIAAEEGCTAILGMDAHRPEQVLDKMPEARALEIVRRYNLELLDTVPLKKI